MIDQRSEKRLSDSELNDYIEALSRGETNAMAPLYQATSPGVYAYALSVLKNTQDAQDVLHDTYVSVYTAAARYHSMGKPMAWIMTIAKNHCLKLLKQRQRNSDMSLEEWSDSADLMTFMRSDEKLLLRHCMKSLADQERQIVVLHAVAGFKHHEIASILRIPLPTVLSKYSRAIQKLRNLLEKEDSSYEK